MDRLLSDGLILGKVDSSSWQNEFIDSLELAAGQGWFRDIEKNILIKPNLCTVASPDSGSTTDVKVIESLIIFLKRLLPSSDIKIIESDSFDRRAEDVFRRLGYEDLKEKYQVQLINLSDEPSLEIKVDSLPYTMKIPRMFFQDQFFISVALPKTHGYQRITAIYKNQFGCIPDTFKEKYHQYLEEVLYFLNHKLLVPDLSIIDGRLGMEGSGPVDGRSVKTDFLLLGKEAIATDITCARLMGFNPKKIPYIRYACKKIGVEIDTIEKPASSLCKNFSFIPDWQYRAIRGKIKVTRSSIVLNEKGKRLVYIFFRLPSYLKERKLIPLYNHLKMKWNTLIFTRKKPVSLKGAKIEKI